MRAVLLCCVLTPTLLTVLLMFLLYAQLRRFRRQVPKIAGQGDMDSFKRLASFQMRAAEFTLPLILAPIIVWALGKFVFGALGWLDVVSYGLLPLAFPVICSSFMVGAAREVRATPASGEFEAERDHVAEVWVREKRPDW